MNAVLCEVQQQTKTVTYINTEITFLMLPTNASYKLAQLESQSFFFVRQQSERRKYNLINRNTARDADSVESQCRKQQQQQQPISAR